MISMDELDRLIAAGWGDVPRRNVPATWREQHGPDHGPVAQHFARVLGGRTAGAILQSQPRVRRRSLPAGMRRVIYLQKTGRAEGA